jgi:hypothetical protein
MLCGGDYRQGRSMRQLHLSFAFCKLLKTMALEPVIPEKKITPPKIYLFQGGLYCKVVPLGNLLCLNYTSVKLLIPQFYPVHLSQSSL